VRVKYSSSKSSSSENSGSSGFAMVVVEVHGSARGCGGSGGGDVFRVAGWGIAEGSRSESCSYRRDRKKQLLDSGSFCRGVLRSHKDGR
jgi:hypothetical protein